ncbi:tRNA N(3)-methylcytidine methyltransferase METTL6-like [Dreissena polymorpha]|uniref:tRNA N(3)-methylcytidine methyltransferase n=1 Tax=Dreissena polymorpha TaxID=45954 RepID=A0A9D4K901_DREPO|nr:tRNA N(3)-methylcytidine methyltransferase METTL6-like [Dreissena polymorpha]XP_052276845.1 tRNA N(3)-methylcytidine methyltransferase METTL6-like [Dreissena polymorpha]XP_052276846.1 tRNA N(3)-methylcytidine methyltransferase METTL6-like [Dreissena polymorpha]XP_052276847.1 tRNA N(3)-methylcytidine methyltransferase METTL6-like [Dreissena polymorpha]KAH3835358.1 hypothetical protein DPMN_108707 [Dreissena polymorpha]
MSDSPTDNDFFSVVTQSLRELSTEEQEKLDKDKQVLNDFKQNKLEKEAEKNWDLFYKRNTTKFFKDRHWTKREFTELTHFKDGERLVVFEVGCGVGNFMFPLLEEEQNVFFYACDFSKRAVEFVKENPKYDKDRCHAFQCDITQDVVTDNVPAISVDVVTMIFVLSAIHPDKMIMALKNIFEVLKPDGCLLLRDYGLYDYAMLRFTPGHKLAENFYVRQDGTKAFYFTIEKLTSLASEAGFSVNTCEYVHRKTVNKKEGLCVPRIFVQAKFVKQINHVYSDRKSQLDSCFENVKLDIGEDGVS